MRKFIVNLIFWVVIASITLAVNGSNAAMILLFLDLVKIVLEPFLDIAP